MRLDPHSAALYAIIGVALIAAGAVMVGPSLSLDQRVQGMAAIAGVLAAVAFVARSRRQDDGDGR